MFLNLFTNWSLFHYTWCYVLFIVNFDKFHLGTLCKFHHLCISYLFIHSFSFNIIFIHISFKIFLHALTYVWQHFNGALASCLLPSKIFQFFLSILNFASTPIEPANWFASFVLYKFKPILSYTVEWNLYQEFWPK